MSDSAEKKSETTVRENVVWHASPLSRDQHELKNGHKAKVVWLTGLPGSGKSTIAHAAAAILHHSGYQTIVLDGDNIRHGLCADLGFSVDERNENIRRVGEVAKLFLMQGTIVFVALVSPLRNAREKVRQLIPDGDFIEVYCNCSLAICSERDPKGLYAKAERGLIGEFTGITSPYEVPLEPALILNTEYETVDELVTKVIRLLLDQMIHPGFNLAVT